MNVTIKLCLTLLVLISSQAAHANSGRDVALLSDQEICSIDFKIALWEHLYFVRDWKAFQKISSGSNTCVNKDNLKEIVSDDAKAALFFTRYQSIIEQKRSNRWDPVKKFCRYSPEQAFEELSPKMTGLRFFYDILAANEVSVSAAFEDLCSGDVNSPDTKQRTDEGEDWAVKKLERYIRKISLDQMFDEVLKKYEIRYLDNVAQQIRDIPEAEERKRKEKEEKRLAEERKRKEKEEKRLAEERVRQAVEKEVRLIKERIEERKRKEKEEKRLAEERVRQALEKEVRLSEKRKKREAEERKRKEKEEKRLAEEREREAAEKEVRLAEKLKYDYTIEPDGQHCLKWYGAAVGQEMQGMRLIDEVVDQVSPYFHNIALNYEFENDFGKKDTRAVSCTYIFLKDTKEFIIKTINDFRVSLGETPYDKQSQQIYKLANRLEIYTPQFLQMIKKRLERELKELTR
ncbi:hypothetical protein OAW66_03290 [Alphaproteobacteria bacterium]|nr:hypothetical protein [Alphaproteobacteria bacterium]